MEAQEWALIPQGYKTHHMKTITMKINIVTKAKFQMKISMNRMYIISR